MLNGLLNPIPAQRRCSGERQGFSSSAVHCPFRRVRTATSHLMALCTDVDSVQLSPSRTVEVGWRPEVTPVVYHCRKLLACIPRFRVISQVPFRDGCQLKRASRVPPRERRIWRTSGTRPRRTSTCL